MGEGVWVAIVVGISSIFTTVVAPLLMAIVSSHIQRQTKKEDYERQDKVAERLISSNEHTARNAKMVAEASIKKLTEISETTKATHKIANNQSTMLLRQILVLVRAHAADHPEDKDAQLAVELAEKNLRSAENAQV